MKSKFILTCAFVIPLISGCNYFKSHGTETESLDSFDQFQADLANRGQHAIGDSDDFKIIVTQVAFPIGTLMRVGSTIPIDYSACTPSAKINAYEAPSLFPSYTLSKKLAVDLGLDNEVIKKLVDFGVNVSDADKVNLSVKGATLQTLADSDLTKTLSMDGCREATKKSSAWLVRGYVGGQRNFSLDNTSTIQTKGKIEKIASFDVSFGAGERSVSLIDDKSVGFLQIVSQITPTTNNEPSHVEKPSAQSVSGKAYIQQDKKDSSGAGIEIFKSLKEANLNVSPTIERIETSKMPQLAQVRYFNDGDITAAKTALGKLQKDFPNASLKKIGLPAPQGQLEIWLPRAQ